VARQDHGGGFANANDRYVRAAHDTNDEVGQLKFERERRHETRAAGAENDNRGDFHHFTWSSDHCPRSIANASGTCTLKRKLLSAMALIRNRQ
jgi:hypothetical protein